MILAKLLFWLSASAILATYILYPFSMPILARLFGRSHVTGDAIPRVTLVIAAYNEASVIREKIENALALDYPRDQMEIFVISDASDDGTDEIVNEYADKGVILKRQEPRGGKSKGLTRFVPEASGEIIVFSDANSIYYAQAIRHLVRHFADPEVGYVVGHQRYFEDRESTAAESESTYWGFEIRLKTWEGNLSSVVGADGAIYAIRSELFFPLSDEDINDFVNPLQIVAKGYRGVFDGEAFCHEEAAPNFQGEFRRKVRIVNRALRGLGRVPEVLNPLQTGWFAYQLLLHKVLRWFTPFFLMGVFAGSLGIVLISGESLYQIALFAQLAFYTLAALHQVPVLAKLKPVYLAYFFCLSSVAALLGTVGVFKGKKLITWNPERQ